MSHVRIILLTFLIHLTVVPFQAANAQLDDWAYLEPASGAFEARFPKRYTTEEKKIRLDDNSEAYVATYSAKVREKGHDKTYLVKLEQKLGDRLTTNMIAFALASDTAQYENIAKSLNGKLVTDMDISYGLFKGKDLFVTYNKEGRKLGIRVRILFTDYSRLYMVAHGPADLSYSFRTNNFFDNIKLYDGLPQVPGNFSSDMKTYTSPKNIFSVKALIAGNPYIEEEPAKAESKNSDEISFSYIDPIIKYKLSYSAKSLITNKPLEGIQIRSLFVEDFIKKYMPDASPQSITVEEIKFEDGKIYTAQASFPTTPENPYTNFLMLEAHQKGNIVVVQSMSGASTYVLSPLSLSTFAAFEFHPMRYLNPEAQEKKSLLRGWRKVDDN